MAIELTLNEFSAGDVERITGLTAQMQREWRRRGFGPEVGKRARFDIFEVAELWIMKLMSDQGIGPAISSRHARATALGLVQLALKDDPRVYSGDYLDVLMWSSSLIALPELSPRDGETLRKQRLALQPAPPSDEPEEVGEAGWTQAKADWLASAALFMRSGTIWVGPYKYVVLWPPDRLERTTTLDAVFRSDRADPARHIGHAVVLDLVTLSRTMARRAGRAFLHVEIFDPIKEVPHG